MSRSHLYSRYLLLLLALILFGELNPVLAQSRREERRAERRGGRNRKKQKKQRLAVLNPDTLPIAYVPVWKYATDDAMRLPALPDAQTVYLPLGSGAIVALDSSTGELKWEAQPAGRIVSALESTETVLLVASRKGDNGGLLRALERTTGLTRWVQDYATVFTSPLTVHSSTIYVAGEDGKLRAIGVKDGQELWSVDLGSVAKARIVIDGEELFLGSESGLLHCLKRSDGGQKWQFQAKDAVRGAVTVSRDMVYFGDSSGYVYALQRSSGKQVWRVRTGAAVETMPKLVGDTLYVASFDNFVYAYDAATGDRRWLVNTLGRLSYDMISAQGGLLVAPQSGVRVYTLSSRGKLTGRYDLPDGNLIAPVVLSGRSIFLVTDRGLQVAEQVSPVQEERGE